MKITETNKEALNDVATNVVANAKKIDWKGLFVLGGAATAVIGVCIVAKKEYDKHKACKAENQDPKPEDVVTEAES